MARRCSCCATIPAPNRIAWGLTRTSRSAILHSSRRCSLEHLLRFADPACGARLRLTAQGPQSDASNNKFRSMRIALSAVTSHSDAHLSPSSLSGARPEGPAPIDGRVEWLAINGPSHPNASSGTKAFAENVAHTARRTCSARLDVGARPHPRVERRVGLQVGALERADSQQQFTPRSAGTAREGL